MSALTTYLLIAFSAILWGANFNLAQPVMAEMQPLVAGASRYLIAAAIMLLIVWFKGEKIPLRHARTYLLLGLVGVFGFNLLFFLGMQSTSAINGALIMAINPLLTGLVAYAVLGDRPDFRQMLAFPIGLIGVGIVVLGSGAHLQIAKGDIFICGACVSWAFYNVFARKYMPKDTSGIASTAGIMIVGALALTAVALASHEKFMIPGLHAGSALLLMSVGGGVLAYLFWNAGIAKLGAAQASIFLNLVPVSSMTIATFGGILPTQVQLIGGLLVIGAVTFTSLPESRLPSFMAARK